VGEWTDDVRRRLTLSGLTPAREAEIVEDVARQLDDAYREALASGAEEADARARAERHIADWPALSADLSRSSRERQPALDRWSGRLDDRAITPAGRFNRLAQLRQDLVLGWRMLRRAPALTAIAVLSLALGIGANTAIFSVLRAVMFRELPIPRADSLMVLTDPESEGMMSGIEIETRTLLSYHEFQSLRNERVAGVLDGLFAFGSSVLRAPVTSDSSGAEETQAVSLVSGTYFPTLGVPPAAGRAFGAEVDRARLAHPVAVISHRFWQSRLGGDPSVIGRTIGIRRTPFQIVAVMPPEFTGLVVASKPDVWVPLLMQEAVAPGRDWLTQPPGAARRTMFLHVLGRLKPGVTMEQAGATVDAEFRRALQAEAEGIADPERRKSLVNANLVIRDARYGLTWLRAEYRQPLYILMALVGLLLLLACANVANLLLARATGRGRELAVRVALGAGRARLVRQLLTESVLLAGIGAAAGLLVAYLGARLLVRIVSGTATPVSLETPTDTAVLLFAIGLALVTGLLFGLAPALRATAVDLNLTLRGVAASIAGPARRPGRWPLGKVLAGAQVGLSVLLLIAAGLFVRTFQHLADAPVGYDPDRLLMFRLTPLGDGYQQPAIDPLFETVLQRLEQLPGVRSATLSFNGLFYGRDLNAAVTFPGLTLPPGFDASTGFDLAGPGYFTTLGVPVLVGRDVERQDSQGLPGCWLNQTAAREFFKDENPVGRRMVAHFSQANLDFEVRGVVADSRTQEVRGEIGRRIYLPFLASPVRPTDAVFEVRTAQEAAQLIPAARAAIRDVDSRLTPPSFHTVPELIGEGLARDRLTAQLSALFSVLALLLASIGLYGVLSYSAGRRVTEIGVRLALGARRVGIVGLIVREALAITALGLAGGLLAAYAATRVVETMLFGLTPRDPMTFAGAAGILLIVAGLAAAVPAWRASRTDPLTALRAQ
jgi:predicted permease